MVVVTCGIISGTIAKSRLIQIPDSAREILKNQNIFSLATTSENNGCSNMWYHVTIDLTKCSKIFSEAYDCIDF